MIPQSWNLEKCEYTTENLVSIKNCKASTQKKDNWYNEKDASIFDDSVNQFSQNLSGLSKISYRIGLNSSKMKRVLREKTNIFNNDENIKLKQNLKKPKLTKQPSWTTRLNWPKTSFDILTKSKQKQKSKNKLVRKQNPTSYKELRASNTKEFSNWPGKENRPPKISQNDYIESKCSKNILIDSTMKRGSVPRIDKSRLITKKSSSISKKALNKTKSNASKSLIKNTGNALNTNSTSSQSMLGYSNSRSKMSTKRLISKQYQTSTEDDKKVANQLEALYHLIINYQYMSEMEPQTMSSGKKWCDCSSFLNSCF